MDEETNRRLTKLEEDSELLVNLEQTVYGPPPARTNGLRARVGALEKEVVALRAWGNDIWLVQRPEHCIGKKAVEELEKKLEEEGAREVQAETVRHQMLIEMRKSRSQSRYTLLVGCIMVLGNLLVAIIQRGS